jgi:hypothetical protein
MFTGADGALVALPCLRTLFKAQVDPRLLLQCGLRRSLARELAVPEAVLDGIMARIVVQPASATQPVQAKFVIRGPQGSVLRTEKTQKAVRMYLVEHEGLPRKAAAAGQVRVCEGRGEHGWWDSCLGLADGSEHVCHSNTLAVRASLRQFGFLTKHPHDVGSPHNRA